MEALGERGGLLQGYASYYFLNLFSNFTFFLFDPENGDGIQQYDRRWYGGFDGRYERQDRLFGVNTTSTAGFQYRIDGPHVVLAAQADRHRLPPPPPDSPFQPQNADILEQSYSPFVKFGLAPAATPWCTSSPAPAATSSPAIFMTSSSGPSQRIQRPGDAQREGQPRPRPLVPDRALRQLRDRIHSNDAGAVILDANRPPCPSHRYEVGVSVAPIARPGVGDLLGARPGQRAGLRRRRGNDGALEGQPAQGGRVLDAH